MSAPAASPWLLRFLAPRHALCDHAISQWHGVGEADTPGEDARCGMYLALAQNDGEKRIVAAAFTAFGPPVVVACADWFCQRLNECTIEDARSLDLRAAEHDLALAPEQRYAALLISDALSAALDNALARPCSNLG
jgi:NifU-like protein involved in Fe-S cluster formation